MPRPPITAALILLVSLAVGVPIARAQSAPNRITILYDAFSAKPSLALDWGYSALVEFEGKRILFDTGNNAALFERNVKQLHIDLTRVDLVVISHRHGDHTAGLRYVLSINPHVPVYVPADETFMTTTSATFFAPAAQDPTLPAKMRYFNGNPPTPLPSHGNAWPGMPFHYVTNLTGIASHIHLISTMSETPGFRDMPEVSLVLDTPKGPIVIVGCSHPGIENILANLVAQSHQPNVYELIGGIHLAGAAPAKIDHTISELLDTYHVQRTALGHCTGERTFALMQKRLGDQYLYAGVGEVLPL